MNTKIGRNDPCPCGRGLKYKKCCLKGPSLEMQISNSKDYFHIKGKTAESFVHELALKTFLTDWCYLNPKLPNGKELCDLLVIFDNIAIIFQIKDLKIDHQNKYKKAEVEKNLRQLSGARRQLFELKTGVELENPRRGKELFDPSIITETFLISILLGEGEEFYSLIEDIKEYTVHVFTRTFTEIIFNELDTISDFSDYLREKERFLKQDRQIIIMGGEEELLAFYLMNDHSFKTLEDATFVTLDEGYWMNLQVNPKYQVKKKEDEISYLWDSIINRAHQGSSEYEKVARELARPNRFERRYLSKVFFDAYSKAHEDQNQDLYRSMLVTEGVTYCFLFCDDPEPRDRRKGMLAAMCLIARGLHPQNKKVLGIATEKKIRRLSSYDFCLMKISNWTEEHQKTMDKLQKETDIFKSPAIKYLHEDEYPETKKV